MSTDHTDTTTADEQATTDDTAETTPAATDSDADSDPDSRAATDERRWLTDDIERTLRYLVVAGLALLALIALLRFYFAASATIDSLIAPAYRSLFQALFNLTILLLSGAGILWQADQLR
ncbi:MAG: hypothetical protein A07HN63_02288 [uncultured archaeon A07HN63]|nr:MAG: hypothetical protein A07HN63_02288 [uncultured archaeon A07HN63]